jgi:hypothetical protein
MVVKWILLMMGMVVSAVYWGVVEDVFPACLVLGVYILFLLSVCEWGACSVFPVLGQG